MRKLNLNSNEIVHSKGLRRIYIHDIEPRFKCWKLMPLRGENHFFI